MKPYTLEELIETDIAGYAALEGDADEEGTANEGDE